MDEAAPILRRSPQPRSFFLPTAAAPRSLFPTKAAAVSVDLSLSCKAALTADLSPSSSPEAVVSKEVEAARRVGARIRVTAPVKVFHVAKSPGLNLCGMEGAIKQYVGLYKGKRVSASFPFKIEFLLPADGDERTIKFFAHLREGEFEFFNNKPLSTRCGARTG